MSRSVAEAVHHLNVIAVNNTYELAPWADLLMAGDSKWWLHYAADALKFRGIKCTSCSSVPFAAVMHLEQTGPEGYDPMPGRIRTGGNSAYQAIHVAMQAGARRILLFGVDLSLRQGVHWHGPHQSLGNPTEPLLARMRQRFETLVEPANRLGVEILNCSLVSELRCFPRAQLSDVL